MSRRILPKHPNLFLTDGGIETTLIFDCGIDLPDFAAFTVLKNQKEFSALTAYYEQYLTIAQRQKTGFILESATWPASSDWGDRIGYSRGELMAANVAAIVLLRDLKSQFETPDTPILISGCIGPRGDGYVADELMNVSQAQSYHSDQIRTLAESDVDVITAITMTNVPETIGIIRAAEQHLKPCVISFTVETVGKLPAGQTLEEAINSVDAETHNGPSYYMINCAHPTHFASV